MPAGGREASANGRDLPAMAAAGVIARWSDVRAGQQPVVTVMHVWSGPLMQRIMPPVAPPRAGGRTGIEPTGAEREAFLEDVARALFCPLTSGQRDGPDTSRGAGAVLDGLSPTGTGRQQPAMVHGIGVP